ncbi:MAG: hypothetical protein P8X82_10690, partial [Gemmatimonadales bacterium]
DNVAVVFETIRATASDLQDAPYQFSDILEDGATRARRVAQETMQGVRDRMGLMSEKVTARNSE